MRYWIEQVGFLTFDEEHPELSWLFSEIDTKWKPLACGLIEEIKHN